ncbi:flippase-like domain-containing protein [Flavobacterium agricola]|uniref:Flippase-like domain-containing protein n=1 Tax=Flavobacterium agricola TaxID=2870839 RepID=A0ABY6M219_9FLAO|nr:lysylphosphatidylglycerol synthase transmembrane domain-containing protein [Flavobacterium agricola]UYW01161.1 flippase-like domain-containing protein [Flavobacterium agricola]
MKASIKKTISIILPLILGVFLVYYAYNQFTAQQLQEIKLQFQNANYNFIVISTIFSLISLGCRAYRWKYSLNYMGYQSNFPNNFMAVCIGYIMNLTVPRSGEISRALVLKNYKNIPFDKGFGSIISERVIDFVILLLFIFTSLIIQFNTLKDFVLTNIPIEKIIYSLIILTLAGILGIYLLFFTQLKLMVLIRSKIKGLTEGVLSVFKMPQRKAFLFYTFVIWASYVATFYYGMKSISETDSLSIGIIISSFVVGSLAITFTNGGFGAFPLMISQILALYGISMTAGTAVGWILWSSQTAIVIILGGLSFIFLPIFNKKQKIN